MNQITFRPTGQASVQDTNTVQECIERCEYLAAYYRIGMEPANVRDGLYITLIETLVNEDLFDKVVEIACALETHEKNGFLFNAAESYLKSNFERVLNIYSFLDRSFKLALATKMVLKKANNYEKYIVIKDILQIHLDKNDIGDAIYVIKNLSFGNPETILFAFGKRLVELHRWSECILIANALTTKKQEFISFLDAARSGSNRAAIIRV